MTAKSEITRADIMPMEEYGQVRDDRRRTISAMKRARRVSVGPDTTFYFENFDTMLHQVHEMLYVEQGGEAQIEDELRAYNPLIPRGEALVATLMIEIDNPVRRAKALRELAGIETHIAMIIGDARVAAVSDDDAERTTPDGKTSSVHFLRFPFTSAQIEAFKTERARVILAVEHPNYTHMTVLSDETRRALAADFA
ncbi:MAG: DUF3501 family protein [Rhodospirillales bacterium]|nr:DUF3501 family protein [Rhodospirillales bacterium]